MLFTGWTIAPHKIDYELDGTILIHFYYVLDEKGNVFDRINTGYDGRGNVVIRSQKVDGYIDNWTDDPYFNFIRDELNTHRIVQDALHSTTSPVGSDGIIRTWNIKK